MQNEFQVFAFARVTKRFAIAFIYFFLFLLPAGVLETTWQKFSLRIFHHALPKSVRLRSNLFP